MPDSARLLILGLVVALGATTVGPAASQLGPDTKTESVLSAARQALGGERLARLKTLSARGQTRRIRGNSMVPTLFQWDLELPDRFVRREESPAESTDPTSSGFVGQELIQVPPMPVAGRAGGSEASTSEPLRDARLRTVQQDLTRLTLAMVAGGIPAVPLTFTYAAQAQAPQGLADIVEAKGPDGFTARLFIDQTTKLPILVSWVATAATPGTGAAGAAPIGAPAGQPAPAATQAPPEQRLYVSDFREVKGIKLPHRLRRATGAETTEETTIEEYRVDEPIPAQRFRVPR